MKGRLLFGAMFVVAFLLPLETSVAEPIEVSLEGTLSSAGSQNSLKGGTTALARKALKGSRKGSSNVGSQMSFKRPQTNPEHVLAKQEQVKEILDAIFDTLEDKTSPFAYWKFLLGNEPFDKIFEDYFIQAVRLKNQQDDDDDDDGMKVEAYQQLDKMTKEANYKLFTPETYGPNVLPLNGGV